MHSPEQRAAQCRPFYRGSVSDTAAFLWQVREEQARLRPEASATITGDVLNQMTYSRQVVKEVLRYRPPAPMVPQVTHLTTL